MAAWRARWPLLPLGGCRSAAHSPEYLWKSPADRADPAKLTSRLSVDPKRATNRVHVAREGASGT